MSALLPGGIQIRWWGHSVFAVYGPQPDQKFLFDPFLANNPAFPKDRDADLRRPGAFDALVITHAHFDHIEDALPLLNGDPQLKAIAQYEVGLWLKAHHIAEDRIVAGNHGGTSIFNDVRLTMTGAVHSSSVGVGGKNVAISVGAAIGYVMRFANGFTIYNTGDTAVTMDMQIVRDLYKPDLVILPIGDFFTMGAEQAAYALKLLQPEFALGAHWHTWGEMPPGTPEALEKEMARYSLKTKLIKLQPGETLA
jgi:L-ascorbate metabolism protein UlaG (beta-lactamase superfamily)